MLSLSCMRLSRLDSMTQVTGQVEVFSVCGFFFKCSSGLMLLACLFFLVIHCCVYICIITDSLGSFLFNRIFFNVLGGGGIGITELDVCWGLPPKI